MENLNLLREIEFLERVESRRKRRTNTRLNPFEQYDDLDFHKRFRLTKETTIEVCKLIESALLPNSEINNALSSMEQLLIALRYYASGTFQINIGDLQGVSQPTASRVIRRVSKQLAALNKDFITFPKTTEECQKVAGEFFKIAQFPGAIGTLDCSHVPILSPGGVDGERFRNRKGFFSLNVQTIISSELIIENVVARWPGSAHDSMIFQNSAVAATFQRSPVLRNYFVLGDSGYANQDCLLTPIQNPSTVPQKRYNKAHILTRNTVERKYGVLKRRFPCLKVGINCHIDNVPAIIVACCVLHNLAVKQGDPEPPVDPEVETLLRHLSSGENASYTSSLNRQAHGGRGTASGEARRNLIIQDYFT